MTTWVFVSALAERLPGAALGEAHEGSPAWYVGRHPFARHRRWDDGRVLLQTWTGEMDTEAALAARRDVFPVVHTFTYRVSTWALLDGLDDRETAELVLESYRIRGPVGRRSADLSSYLP